jgi:citrate lyase subunit beta/citryl-CoA lyase
LRLRRSELSTPGTSEKMMTKAAGSDADLVFLDLEDAVAPNLKASARPGIVAALNGLDWGSKTRAVRVNGVHTPWCHDDVIEVVSGAGANLDIVIIPKVKAPRDVWFVESLLSQLEDKLGLEAGRIGI